MANEKAYKVLAEQEKISNNEAKKLIDNGIVFLHGRRVAIARAEVPKTSRFKVQRIEKLQFIFEDENIIAVNKPVFMESEEAEKKVKDAFLLNRLDRDTSGVLLLSRNKEYQKKVIETFKKREVYKEYVAVVSGRIAEPFEIDKRLKKDRRGGRAVVSVSRSGEEAITKIEPISIHGKYSKVKAVIETGRTHQIRVHLQSAGYPILGDRIYGGKEYERLMLHSKKTELLGYSFEAKEPKSFIMRLD
jgi:23S rRNA pseudouridine1911/1915/1917 synthase